MEEEKRGEERIRGGEKRREEKRRKVEIKGEEKIPIRTLCLFLTFCRGC